MLRSYRIEQAAPGLYTLALWDDGWSSFNNCYVLRHGSQIILIDSGKAEHAPALVGALHELGLAEENITAIVATHVHHDHVGGAMAAQFAGVSKNIHAADKGLIPEGVRDAWRADVPDDGQLLGLECMLSCGHARDCEVAAVELSHVPRSSAYQTALGAPRNGRSP